MTVHIDDLTTEIEPHDRLALELMTRAVLADRPSFRRIAARAGGRTVEIYTRRDRAGGGFCERLVVAGGDRPLRLDRRDQQALERLLHDVG